MIELPFPELDNPNFPFQEPLKMPLSPDNRSKLKNMVHTWGRGKWFLSLSLGYRYLLSFSVGDYKLVLVMVRKKAKLRRLDSEFLL